MGVNLLEHIELFNPNIIITTNLKTLIQALDEQNIPYQMSKQMIVFEAITYENFISSIVAAFYQKDEIYKLVIKNNFKAFAFEESVILKNNFKDTLINICGKPTTHFKTSSPLDDTKEIITNRWYHDFLFLELVENQATDEMFALFTLKDLPIKKAFFNKVIFIASFIGSLLWSLLMYVTYGLSQGFTSPVFNAFLGGFLTFFILFFLAMSIIDFFKKPVNLKNPDFYIPFEQTINDIKVAKICYEGSINIGKSVRMEKAVFMFIKDHLKILTLKGKKVVERIIDYESFLSISLYDETLTLNLKNNAYFFIILKDMRDVSSFIHDFEHHQKKEM